MEVITEEEYRKIIENKDKLESEGYKIIEDEKTVAIVFPTGEKYIYIKRAPTAETERIVLPREGKRFKAIIKRIKIGEWYKLAKEVGININTYINRCKGLKDSRERYNCIKRLTQTAYLIIFEIPDMNVEGFEIIRYSLHPNSRLRKLSQSYKEFKVGQKIWVYLDDRGKLRITTPPEEEEEER